MGRGWMLLALMVGACGDGGKASDWDGGDDQPTDLMAGEDLSEVDQPHAEARSDTGDTIATPRPDTEVTTEDVEETDPTDGFGETDEIDDVHEIHEVDDVHEIHEVDDAHEIHQVDDVHEIQEVHEVHEVDTVHEVHEVHDTAVCEDTVTGDTGGPDTTDDQCLSIGACTRWSDPTTWGGHKPAAGDTVVIPAGRHIILDEDPPPLAGLTIDGTLELGRADHTLEAGWILVHGTLRVGTEPEPFVHRATFRLTGSDPEESVMGMGTRGILVMGGALELHGAPPAVVWTRLSAHAVAGTTTLSLDEEVDWQPGDAIAVAPTDYYSVAQTERRTIASATDGSVALASPLGAFRWGLLQYVTGEGLSLSPDGAPTQPRPGTPTVLDQRAEVANLSRNIVIEAPDDTLWRDEGFGVHVMVMGAGAIARVHGVTIRRAGQRGRLGRYPFHWHRLSYDATRWIGDTAGQYLSASVIDGSANRGIVIHATNGLLVADNVVHDVRGHGVFTEDAVERRNTIRGNLVLRVRNPAQSAALKQHEVFENGGASGFWLANPDNVVTDNTAADCQGHGFWLAFPANPWGQSIGVPMRPNRLRFGVFDGNTTHTSGFEGLMLDFVEIDNDGNVAPASYMSTTDEADPTWDSATLRRFAVSRLTTWKSGRGGVWDRVVWVDFTGVVAADNCGRSFAGSGLDGVIEGCLIIGTSLNHRTPRPRIHFPDTLGGDETPVAFATYHSTFDIRHNLIVNFPLSPGRRSGAFATEDYYIRPVDKGLQRNVGNVLIGTHPGFRSAPVFAHYTLAGALWDPSGLWGPAGNYFVFDTPYFTYGQPVAELTPAGQAGGVSVPGPFYGLLEMVVNNETPYYYPLMALEVTRLDPDSLAPVGRRSVGRALSPDWLLANMRHFAVHRDGVYDLAFPDSPPPVDLELRVENLLAVEDTAVLALEFDGEVVPNAIYTMAPGSGPSVRIFREVASRELVMDSDGLTWWQDAENDRIWVKLQGGSWQFWDPTGTHAVPTTDELLYRQLILHVNTD